MSYTLQMYQERTFLLRANFKSQYQKTLNFMFESLLIEDEKELKNEWFLDESQTNKWLAELRYKTFDYYDQYVNGEKNYRLFDFLKDFFNKYPHLKSSLVLAKCSVSKQKETIDLFDENIQTNKDVIVSLMIKNSELITNYLHREDVITEAMEVNCLVYSYLPKELKEKRSIASRLVLNIANHPNGEFIFSHLPEKFQNEEGFIKTALNQKWSVYKYLPEQWKNKEHIKDLCVKNFFKSESMDLNVLIDMIDPSYWSTINSFSLVIAGIENNKKEYFFFETIAEHLCKWMSYAKENSLLKEYIINDKLDEKVQNIKTDQTISTVTQIYLIFQNQEDKFNSFLNFKNLDKQLNKNKNQTKKIIKV